MARSAGPLLVLAAALLQPAAALGVGTARPGTRPQGRPGAEAEEGSAAGSRNASEAQPQQVAGQGLAGSWLQRARRCLPIVALLAPPARSSLLRGTPGPGGGHAAGPGGAEPGLEAVTVYVQWNLVSQTVYLLLALFVAYLYKRYKAELSGPDTTRYGERDLKRWTSQVLEPVLIWSCLCPGIRWADTMDMAQVLPGYWEAFLLCFAVMAVTGLVLGLPGWVLLACFFAYFRGKLRARFEMEPSCCADLCGYCCCQPFMLAQEARHVEDARLAEAAA